MFTDGIGCISGDLVEKMQKLFETKATVFQIRYQGAKGILALNRTLDKNTIVLRKSMVKFQCPVPEANQYLDILD